MVHPRDFSQTMRCGKTGVSAHLMVHYFAGEDQDKPALVGLVVPKRYVKLATARNLHKRHIRHVMRQKLDLLPAGSKTVVRIRTKCDALDFVQVKTEITRALKIAQEKSQKNNAQTESPQRVTAAGKTNQVAP